MKSNRLIITVAFFFAIIISSVGQEQNQMRYLFDDTDIRISGFGGPLVGFTAIGDDFAATVGGGGGILMNQKFFFGGYGESTVTRHPRNLSIYSKTTGSNEEYDLRAHLNHGGFWIGYIHAPHKPVHFGFSTKLGFGAVSLTQGHFVNKNQDFEFDNVFVVNPQLEIEMNLLKWFKINVGVGYQLVSGINKKYEYELADGSVTFKNYFESKDFNKPIGHITMVFG